MVKPSDAMLQRVVLALREGWPPVAVWEEREAEVDLFLAASRLSLASEASRAAMVTILKAQGNLVAALDAKVAGRLGFKPITQQTDFQQKHPAATKRRCNFALQVDHKAIRHGGVSPYDRILTLSALANPNSTREEFDVPGHTDIAIAAPGGILERQGHTEALVALLIVANLYPVGLMIEVASQRHWGMADIDEVRDRFGELPIIEDIGLIKKWYEEYLES